jgi:hypothetical protein
MKKFFETTTILLIVLNCLLFICIIGSDPNSFGDDTMSEYQYQGRMLLTIFFYSFIGLLVSGISLFTIVKTQK